ncbi:Toll/interleukin-1 receptor-like proteiny [Sesbania bispinosa]|nr:Toll/interleukin-1 receptor-like proteiny [Sesbania bispinosa]
MSTYSVSVKGKSVSESDNTPQTEYDVFVSFRGDDIRDGFLSHLIEAFHRKKIRAFVDDKLQMGDALNKSSNQAGIKSSDFRHDGELVEEVVNLLLKRLCKYPLNSKGLIHSKRLIGIDRQMAHLEWFYVKNQNTLVLLEFGEWVVLARQPLQVKYVTNYGEVAKIDTPNGLSNGIVRRIDGMKVLIVLEDVNDSDHLENLLLEARDMLGSDSRIIITTRDKQVLTACKADAIHKVGELSCSEALELFNLNAFNQSYREKEYYELSKRVVDYASGIPLVLKVLGCLLHGKDKEVWESQLNKLEKMSNKKFTMLKDKALVTFSEDNINGVSMHDIIREMAWEIVRRESSEEPGSRSRLWDFDDCREVLENDKGTEAIRSIRVLSSSLKLSPHTFAKMSKLKFLDYYGSCDCPQGLQSLSSELRYLRWVYYPQATLPQKFSAEKLVILNLAARLFQSYNLEVLEAEYCRELSGVHSSIFSLNKLNTLDLCYCGKIATLTSDTHSSSISYLNVDCCYSLREFSVTSENMKKLDLTNTMVKALPSSFEHQSKLEIPCLRSSYIKDLPSCMKKLTRLQYLDITNCARLQTIPELPPSLETLLAGGKYGPGQLETVCFPTVSEQFKENRKWVELWNCLDLDEHSLMAIELNVQINMEKFAHQHLSAPKHDYVESYNLGYDYDDSYQVVYVYPGSSVPEWLEHRTMEGYILIDLSCTPHSPQLGFIFCFILEDYRFLNDDQLLFEITISDGNEEGSATMCT